MATRQLVSSHFSNYINSEITDDTGKVVVESHETPDYSHKREDGALLPATPYEVYRQKFTFEPPEGEFHLPTGWPPTCTPSTKYSGEYLGVSGYNVPSFSEPSVNWAYLHQEAVARCNQATFDVLTEIAEAGEALRMVRNFKKNMMLRVKRVVRAWKRERRYINRHDGESTWGTERAMLEAFSGAWLEYRYGWRPLVGSARSLYDAVQRMSQGVYQFAEGRKSQTDTQESTSSWCVFVSSYFHDWNIPGTLFHSKRTDVNTAFAQRKVFCALRNFGMDPLTTAWELVPYSFVVDWFLNIDSVLSAHSPFQVSAPMVRGQSVKTTLQSTATCPRRELSFPHRCSVAVGPGVALLDREAYRRDPVEGDVPWDISLTPNIDWAKGVDSLALLHQAILGYLRAHFKR